MITTQARTTSVTINGKLVNVPSRINTVYWVEVHKDLVRPDLITAAFLTADLLFSWNAIIEELGTSDGWGRVVAWDVMIPTRPRWTRDLGRIDGPTAGPEKLRFTPAGDAGSVPVNTCGKCGAMYTCAACPRCPRPRPTKG